MLETPEAAEDVLQVISFRLGSENFALDILDVQEILREQSMTRVPGSSSVGGVIHLRGKILPVITLREHFGFAAVSAGAQRIVVVQKGAVVAGFLVDSVPEVLRLASRDVRPLQHREAGSCDGVSGAVMAVIGKMLTDLRGGGLPQYSLDTVLNGLRECQRALEPVAPSPAPQTGAPLPETQISPLAVVSQDPPKEDNCSIPLFPVHPSAGPAQSLRVGTDKLDALVTLGVQALPARP